ncbi:MAG: lysylphosphatidylglycerol synthase transmembrane domain-containing protein [Acidobacteriota bacterium]
MFKNKFVYLALSAAVSIALFWLLFSKIQTEEIIRTLSHIYIPALILYLAVALLAAWLRAWRYKWLLRPLPIGWGNILLVTFIRNSLIDLLPARLGSLSFIYVLNRRLGFPFEAATSTFVTAFVLDFLTISPFLVTAILSVGLGANAISNAGLLAAALLFFLGILAVFWKIVPVARFILGVYQWFLAALKVRGKKFSALSLDKFELTIRSLAAIRAEKKSLPIFALSLFIRLAKYVSVFALFCALLRSHGFALSDLNFWIFILGLSGAELTSALPVKGLAGFGTWESAWALTFRLMSFDTRLAILSGIGVHLITNLFEYSLGIASILTLAWPFIRRPKGKP